MSTTNIEDHSSVFSKGGGGTVFEQSVQTAFVTTLLVRGKVPGLPTGEVIEVAFQTTRLGFRTDDILIKVRSHQGEHQLLAQVKHNLTISTKNGTFEEVMTAFWQDFTNQAVFNSTLDRLLIIKSEMTQVDKRDTVTLLNWAKSKASADDFYLEVDRIDSKIKALKVLSDVLQKANNGQALDRERLWQFLRCLVILEYDFGQESSNSETNFLNLIKLAKNPTVAISEKAIWDSVHASVARLNKDGGSVTLESIQAEPFATYFDPARLYDSYAAFKKLQEDSQAVIGPLKNTIADFHLARPELRDKLTAHINDHKFTIVIGEPGAGKSALLKEVITDSTPDTVVLTFKADQFNRSHLSQVFTGLGVTDSLTQLSACLSAIPKKIIFIDSFEKLLEGDPDNAFRQLMHVLDGAKDVRVIATSRTYAVNLLIQKYALINASVVEVPLLTEGEDGEVEQILVAFPRLRPLATNSQIRQVLRSPKYLDYAVQWVSNTTDDINSLTLTEFKDRLWQHIVENHLVIRNGMPAKRSKAFIEIALLRAQRMSLYAEPEQADDTAIEELVNDNVLTKQVSEHKYTPSHDILEDWALIKHIRRLREVHTDPEAFYQHVGNKPALRRAFRLWTEDVLRQQPGTVFQLVRDTRQQAAIERYWADEVLIAIFRSDESAAFFVEFESELLQDQAQFLQRALHLLRTACKERQPSSDSTLLYPVGSGWKAALEFVRQHLAQLDLLRPLIIGLLIDWSYSLYKRDHIPLSVEINAAKHILFGYLSQIENRERVWSEEPLKNRVKGLINIAFELTQHAKDEVKAILERAIPGTNDRYDYHDRSFYGRIRKMTLSGVYNHTLTKFLPEQVIAIAKAAWLRKPRPKRSEQYDNLSPIHKILDQQEEDDHYSLDKNGRFGLENHINDFPSGIYKTPVCNLLFNNWQQGVDFLLEMVNHCTSHYVKSREARGDEVVEVQLHLSDGHWVKQSGNHVLWQAYRGTTVSSYLLESLLMSLEAYLLRMAKMNTEVSQENVKFLFDYLLRRSNSVAISGVLVSVAIAHPQEVGEAMLPLLGIREFYDWDIHRALEDYTGALAPMDNEISYAQRVRHESNNLPHRKKYYNGLKGFILDLQFNHKLFNESLFTVFDRMWQEADEQDVYWRKALHEIDARKWQITGDEPEKGAFIIQPAYEPAVQQIVDDYQPRQEFQQQAVTASTWIREVHERKEGTSADYVVWEQTYERYQVVEDFDVIHDRPITLAVIGLRDLTDVLTSNQRTWCFNIIVKVVDALILGVKRQSEYLGSRLTVSLFDQKIALVSLPLLLKTANEPRTHRTVIKLLFRVITTYFVEYEMKPVLASLREQLWQVDAAVANRVWWNLIRFAQVRQAHEKEQWRAYQNEKLQKRIEQAEDAFIDDVASGKRNENVNFQYIKLTTWQSHLLTRALMMLPYNTRKDEHLEYRKFFIPLFLKGLDKDFDREERFDSRPLIHHDDHISLQQHLRDYLLYCDHEDSAEIAELLLKRIFQILDSPTYHRDGGYDFIKWTFQTMIWELDQIVYNQPESIGKRTTENFWRIWERFFQVLSRSKKRPLMNLLFLEHDWKQESTHWKPLEGKKGFLKRISDDFSQYDIRPLIKLLSTVGDQTLLPDGLRWVVAIAKKHPENLPALLSDAAERLINRLYQRYIIVIKTDVSLLNDFIWLLDQMTDLGSSQAYITRENLITYKNSLATQ